MEYYTALKMGSFKKWDPAIYANMDDPGVYHGNQY